MDLGLNFLVCCSTSKVGVCLGSSRLMDRLEITSDSIIAAGMYVCGRDILDC